MAQTIFSDLNNLVDGAVGNFVGSYSSAAISTITPIAISSITLYFMLYGIAVMRGAVSSPLGEFLMHAIKLSVITGIALSATNYQSYVIAPLQEMQNVLPAAITGQQNVASVIDQAAGKGFELVQLCVSKFSMTSPADTAAYFIIALVVLATTGVVIAIYAAYFILAKIGLTILLGIGPLFIFALAFKPTAKFFDAWLGQCLTKIFTVLLLSATASFMVFIYSNYVTDIRLDGDMDLWQSVGALFVLGVANIIIAWNMPGIASALGGGASVSAAVNNLRELASGSKSVAKTASKATGADKVAKAAGSMINKAGGSAVNAAKGYFKRGSISKAA